ncbi:MAG: pyruvate formate lyase family protein, partial [Coriobacteriales bacterium]|nr:pyruvate formate lyase family protein [Coriobacteriales bacterium]
MSTVVEKKQEVPGAGAAFWKGRKYEVAPVSPRIKKIKQRREYHDNGHVVLCAERTKIYTDYYKAHEDELPVLKRAGALYDWCAKKTVRLEEDEMFVGNMASDWRAAQIYVEWGIGWLKDALELPEEDWTREWGTMGVFAYVSPEDKKVYREAVDYWKDRCIQAHVLSTFPDELWDLKGDNCTSFGNRDKAGTAFLPAGHFIGNHRKVIEVGWGGIREEAEGHIQALMGKVFGDDARRFTFWRAMKKVAEGAILLTNRYAELVHAAWENEPEGERKDELKMMAEGLA